MVRLSRVCERGAAARSHIVFLTAWEAALLAFAAFSFICHKERNTGFDASESREVVKIRRMVEAQDQAHGGG